MKSLLGLTVVLVQECARICSVDPTRDLKTLRERVSSEGDSFLTITLPSFCQSFERSLDEGRIDQNAFPGFTRVRRSGPPAFLQGFLSMVFDTAGMLRADVSSDVIYLVRQICLLHKKSWAIANKRRQTAAIRGYISAEAEINESFDDPDQYFRKVAGVVVSDLLSFDPYGFRPEEIVGRHGPGATVEKFTTNQKWTFRFWHDRLEQVFAYSDHCISDSSHMLEPEVQDRVTFLPENEEPPVRVVFVPKTMKTPRVIAIEPAAMQYAQQAVLKYLVPLIEGKRTNGRRQPPITAGHVNFTDQSINQKLALKASRDRGLATIDMKEASDRVSLAHAKAVFAVSPKLWEAVEACRTRRAELPDGTTVSLKKFASMGSAMCFPTEALAFFIAIVASRLRKRGLPVTYAKVREYSRRVYVYGDDILVPADEAESIGQDLTLYGFRVNKHKSFWTGRFRESCGVDAYAGQDVTPVYCRFAPPDRTESEAIVSWVAMANGLYDRGLWSTASGVRKYIESKIGALPVSPTDNGGLRWTTVLKQFSVGRWNGQLHRFEVRSYVPSPARRPDHLEGYAALHKCLAKLETKSSSILDVESPDRQHLTDSVRRGALALKRRWLPV